MINKKTSLRYIFFSLAICLISFPVSEVFAQVPAAPSNLTAVAIYNDQIKLNWNDNSGNENGFKILRVVSQGVTQLIGTAGANQTQFYVFGLTPNTTYTFVVQSYNTYGNSPFSNEATATTPYNQAGTPNPPSNLVLIETTVNSVTIGWQDHANNELGFKIARKLPSDTNYVIIDSVENDVLTYREVGLSPSSDYFYKVCAYNRYGFSSYTNILKARTREGSVGIDPIGEIPESFYLKNNYPNPFNPETTIEFGIPSGSFVRLSVFNTLGEEIAVLLNGSLPAGTFNVQWNASNFNSGMYFYRIEVTGADATHSDVKKMILVK